jgi:hypothetical protein
VQAVLLEHPGHNSNTAAQLVMLEYHADTGGPGIAQFQMPVCPAVTYQMTFDYRVDRKQEKCSLYIRVGDSNPPPKEFGTTPYLGILPIPLNHITPWLTWAFNFSSDWYPRTWFALGLGCDGSVTKPNASTFLDNFAVRPIGTAETLVAPRPLGREWRLRVRRSELMGCDSGLHLDKCDL